MSVRWLVDGMNVIGSRPDGWWRDRAGAMRKLVAALEAFVERTGEEVTVVFDGRAADERPAPGASARGRLWVEYAPGGRNAADDVIVDMVAELREPAAVSVVTSDKGLTQRIVGSGVEVVPVGRFRRLLEDRA